MYKKYKKVMKKQKKTIKKLAFQNKQVYNIIVQEIF